MARCLNPPLRFRYAEEFFGGVRMNFGGQWRRLAAVAFFLAPGLGFAQGWQHLGNVQKVEKLPDGVELLAGKAKARVTVFREGIFRVRVAPNGTFPKDYSW